MIRFLDNRPPIVYWATCMTLVPLLGTVDFYTGYEFSFSLFYVGPISIAAWYLGKWPGFAFAGLSALIWFVADIQSGHEYSHNIFYMWNTMIRLGFFVIVVLLLSQLDRVMESERNSARSDQVTGAANRYAFSEWVSAALERARRHGNAFTLVYMDLDNFKFVNDHHGHSAGDAVLRTVAETMRKHSRGNDVVCRLGGDEFALLLPEADAHAARAAVEKTHAALLNAMHANKWPVTFSIGVVTYSEAPASIDDATNLADELMYSVKKSGKNSVKYSVYSG